MMSKLHMCGAGSRSRKPAIRADASARMQAKEPRAQIDPGRPTARKVARTAASKVAGKAEPHKDVAAKKVARKAKTSRTKA
jgi:hypothetical protein